MIKYGLGTVPYDESASACDGVGSRIGHRRKIRLLPPCCHLIPSTALVAGRCAPARPAQPGYTLFLSSLFERATPDRAGARPISVNLSKASADECILSRRDSMIVAIQRDPRPGGTAEVIVSPRDICRRN